MNIIKTIFLLFLVITSISSAFSQEYYGDYDIIIDSSGNVEINGLSNVPSLQTPVNTDTLTSKKGAYWTFNLTTPETFDSFVFELTLPKNSQINYIKTTPSFRLEDRDGQIVVIGSGNDKPMTIIVQYKISSNSQDSQVPYLLLLGFFIIFGAIMGAIINSIFFKREKKKKKKIKVFEEDEHENIDLSLLTPRQQDIMKILFEEKRITQKEIEQRINIPKSSISRNIKTLEIKGYIKKEQVGNTNYILLSGL